MKKKFCILAVLLLCALLLPLTAGAETQTGECGADGDNLTWTLDGTALTISGTGKMNDYFSSPAPPWKTGITSVTIQSGVTSIGNYAFYNCSQLTSVTIANSVTSIGKNAFDGCTALTSLNLPTALTSVGEFAFDKCSRLNAITIPGTMTNVGQNSFAGAGMESVIIQYGVTTIGNYAFRYCGNLKSVSLPSSISSIGVEAFEDCTSLTTITIPGSVTHIGMFAFYNCTGLTSITFAGGNTSIRNGAFQGCTSLTDAYFAGSPEAWNNLTNRPQGDAITIHYTGSCGDNLTWTLDGTALTITGTGAMADYTSSSPAPWGTNITSVSLPSGLTSIDDDVFAGCPALTSIVYSGTLSAWSSLSENAGVPWNATVQCSDGKIGPCGDNLTYRLTGAALTISGWGAMADYSLDSEAPWGTGITSVSLPEELTSIGDYAFYDSGLTGVTIRDGVTAIGEGAFSECGNLTSVSLPSSINSIGEDAFGGCTSLTSITIPGSVTQIDRYAFYGCSGLTSITIAGYMTTFGQSAFHGCTGLTDVYFGGTPETWSTRSNRPQGDAITMHYTGSCGDNLTWTLEGAALTITGTGAMADYSSSSHAPWGTNFTSVSLPSGLTGIGDYAFYDCAGLTDVYFGGTRDAWNNLSNRPENVTVHYACGDSLFWTLNGTALTFTGTGAMADYSLDSPAPWGKNITSVSLPSGLTNIGDYAFYDCADPQFTSVEIPASVTDIGEHAFCVCYYLTGVTLPPELRSIGQDAFYGCNSLTSITIPGTVETIGTLAFALSGLQIVTVQNGVTAIDEDAFSACLSLQTVRLPSSISYIGLNAFSGCFKLKNVYFGGTPAAWSALSNTPANVTVHYTCGENLTWTLNGAALTITGTGAMADYTYDSHAPWGINITSVSLPSGLTHIGAYAFKDSNLTGVTIPAGVESIGDHALDGCNYLGEVKIANDNISFGQDVLKFSPDAFVYAAADSNLSKSLTRAGYTFRLPDTCYNMKHIFNSEGESIGLELSRVTDKTITSMTVPTGVIRLTDGLFRNFKSLQTVVLPAGLTEIPQSLFYNCTALTSVTIPEGVTSIGDCAFQDCGILTSLTLPSTLQTIGAEAFEDCGFTSLAIPSGVTSVGNSAFKSGVRLYTQRTSSAALALSKAGYSFTEPGEAYSLECANWQYQETPDLCVVAADTTATSIVLPEGVTEIGFSAFNGCSSLASVTLPSTLKAIDACAFKGCSSLSSIVLPDGMTHIYNNAFKDCESLTSINLPSSLTYIDSAAFKNSPNVTYTFACQSTADEWATAQNIDYSKVTLVHVEVTDDAVAATCIAIGLTEGKHCSRCNAVLTAQQTVSALGHSTTEISAVDATCTTAGNNAYFQCVRLGCGLYFTDQDGTTETTAEEQVIAALGHEEVTDDAAEPTCTAEGKTEGKHCSRCNEVLTEQETVAALGHDKIIDPLVSPTDTQTGLTQGSHCTRCNTVFEAQETIPALNDMQTLRLPAQLTAIEEEAFTGAAFEAIVISGDCTSIGVKAFADCPNLIYAFVPLTVTEIAPDAFDNCPNLILDRGAVKN